MKRRITLRQLLGIQLLIAIVLGLESILGFSWVIYDFVVEIWNKNHAMF